MATSRPLALGKVVKWRQRAPAALTRVKSAEGWILKVIPRAQPSGGSLLMLIKAECGAVAMLGPTPAWEGRHGKDAYEIALELQGVSADDLRVLAQDGTLTVQGRNGSVARRQA